MSRRPPARRYGDSGGGGSSSYLHIGLVLLAGLMLIFYLYSGSGEFGGNKEFVSRVEGDFSCTVEVQRAIPILKKAYGDSMGKVLHVGPDSCSVVSRLLKEDETEAWGVEPYDIEDADRHCKRLVRKGIVRVADIKFPLPYRPKSFSVVIVSDALDYLSPRYLNKTLPDLARVSADGVVIFSDSLFHFFVMTYDQLAALFLLLNICRQFSDPPAGLPGQRRAKVSEVSKFGRAAKLRSATWWVRYFLQNNLEENETALKKFEQASIKSSYRSNCQIFHLKSFH
ncbi:hypothetical protein EZV62_021744 [Acer yangbiense]|uniref:Methyltransferase type 11 domain-containing protein n=1 Tax=Acer yangbiense TaxID=1000413 RepID=A0A5C7H7J5_9ROSI|nr:hypothetical protein EZV62_021744 [Acer yangbiense]